ncbi:hypothetical protein MKX07_005931 [Trichoderma sp. CBMAI-0711]|nr:hypothetical protein MKX07_005931 [Trichoderma sp. CBMAI-0711]
MLVLQVLQRLEGRVVLLAAYKLVGMVDGMQHRKGLSKGIRRVGNVLAHSLCIDKSALLVSKLLGTCLDRLVELENLGGEVHGAFADLLQPVNRVEELLVLGQSDPLNVCLAILGVAGQGLQQRRRSSRVGGILEHGDEVVEVVGVGC